MCQTFNIDGIRCDTAGELRAALGEAVTTCNGDGIQDHQCCCGVDAKTTAKKAGYRIKQDSFGWVLTKRKES